MRSLFKTTVLLALLLTSLLGYGQLGVSKVKSKIKSKAETVGSDKKNEETSDEKTSTQKTGNSGNTKGDKVSEREEYFNTPISKVESNPGSKYAEGNLEKALEQLEVIKKEDPNYARLPILEERYANGKKLVNEAKDKLNLRKDLVKSFDAMSDGLLLGKIKDISLLNRTKYDSLLNLFTQNGFEINPQDQYDYPLIQLNRYFVLEKEKFIKEILEKYDMNKISANKWSSEVRSKEGFEAGLKYRDGMESFKFATEQINEITDYYSKAVKSFPESNEISTTNAKVIEMKEDLEKFKSSGDFDAMMERVKYRELSGVRMGKPAMKDASIDAVIKKELATTENYKLVKRIVITDAQWIIKKNSLGVPLYKMINAEFAYTDEDGNCCIKGITVTRNYNGSSYEAMQAAIDFGLGRMGQQILCENVNK